MLSMFSAPMAHCDGGDGDADDGDAGDDDKGSNNKNKKKNSDGDTSNHTMKARVMIIMIMTDSTLKNDGNATNENTIG